MVVMSPRSSLVEVVVGSVSAGGGCVARLDDGRVAFIRHSVPGERVRARITAESKTFVRADAVEIVEASSARVTPPCRYAGPSRCGGCDWQHISLAAQRKLKGELVSEQLERLAGVALEVAVEAVAGDVDGLGWRSRVRYSVSPAGHLGLRKHRSHLIQRIDRCIIAGGPVRELRAERLRWAGAASVEVFAMSGAGLPVVSVGSRRHRELGLPAAECGLVVDDQLVREPGVLRIEVLGHRFRVSAGVFWQVHEGAAALLARAVLDLVENCEGRRAADLFAGAGLFSVLLAGPVGKSAEVVAVERDARACADLTENVAGMENVRVVRATVSSDLVDGGLNDPHLVVVDPPRQGAGVRVMEGLLRLRSLERIVYVSCDAASFARDLRVALDAGWVLASLRVFDLFPMTEHVELVAALDAPGRAVLDPRQHTPQPLRSQRRQPARSGDGHVGIDRRRRPAGLGGA
jgi:tRNA/tmRNA/rRNA uracil-C5-methylase (TrmA/RlmC/RlmD family)